MLKETYHSELLPLASALKKSYMALSKVGTRFRNTESSKFRSAGDNDSGMLTLHSGGIPASEQIKNYKGEVNYNEEDDQHFPTLTVEQTLNFSLLNKTKKHQKGNIPIIISALLKMFGIPHTRHTL